MVRNDEQFGGRTEARLRVREQARVHVAVRAHERRGGDAFVQFARQGAGGGIRREVAVGVENGRLLGSISRTGKGACQVAGGDMMIGVQPVERFTERADYYAKYRPGYPDAVVEAIARETALPRGALVADIGSGTGISAELFLRHGYRVAGVEPNAAMRAAAEQALARNPEFRSVDGRAEATALADGTVDLIVAATAFHWFDPEGTRREWLRILKPDGWVALLWNRRRDHGDFMEAYEALLRAHAPGYAEPWDEQRQRSRLSAVEFLPGALTLRFDNAQDLDLESLRGRALSSSYAPLPGSAAYPEFARALAALFAVHQRDGRIRFVYDTELYLGRPAATASRP